MVHLFLSSVQHNNILRSHQIVFSATEEELHLKEQAQMKADEEATKKERLKVKAQMKEQAQMKADKEATKKKASEEKEKERLTQMKEQAQMKADEEATKKKASKEKEKELLTAEVEKRMRGMTAKVKKPLRGLLAEVEIRLSQMKAEDQTKAQANVGNVGEEEKDVNTENHTSTASETMNGAYISSPIQHNNILRSHQIIFTAIYEEGHCDYDEDKVPDENKSSLYEALKLLTDTPPLNCIEQ